MTTAGQDSGLHAIKLGGGSGATKSQRSVWLNGEVVGCQCPECGSPVAIRVWLMLGDCLHCGASFELTEEQEREVRRLLAVREQKSSGAPLAPVAKSIAKPQAATPTVSVPPRTAPRAAPPMMRVQVPPLPRRVAAARRPVVPVVVEKQFHWSDFLPVLPAWLVSMIVHILLIILLALWIPRQSLEDTEIVLSAVLGSRHQEGERGIEDLKVDEVELSDPGEPPAEEPIELPPIDDPKQTAAEQDAAELRSGADEIANMPDLSHVLTAFERPPQQRMFEGRDPRVRAAVVNAEGGTTLTEAAVARGLRWIAKHQHGNGSWSLDQFHRTGDCKGQCDGRGHESDTAATAMAILPMLGAGQTHRHGRYSSHVERGLHYLIKQQDADGDLRGKGIGRMYAHGQAAIVLCEAFALTQDEELRDCAQRATDFIVNAQHKEGGWRYTPGERGDTSVVGWQLMALRSAKMAGLEVPEKVFERADKFLDRVQGDSTGAIYCYQPHRESTATMTAEALLCRQYLGWPENHPGMNIGSKFLVSNWLPNINQPNIYYWYYATQVMHHLGGQRWQIWNEAMRDTLLEMQETEGHATGSWRPLGGAIGNHDTDVGGRLYMTSLATCTLEVYYRHLPIYRQIEVKDATSTAVAK